MLFLLKYWKYRGWVFLLVPAHPCSPRQRAVKRLLLLLLLLKYHGKSFIAENPEKTGLWNGLLWQTDKNESADHKPSSRTVCTDENVNVAKKVCDESGIRRTRQKEAELCEL